jgi:hypothetical protein
MILLVQILWFGSVLAWIVAVIAQFNVIVNRNPGVKLFQARLLFIPFIMQFGGRYFLTNRGMLWRAVSWGCFATFVVANFAIFQIYDSLGARDLLKGGKPCLLQCRARTDKEVWKELMERIRTER